MVEDAPGDDRVPLARDGLELGPPEALALRSVRIDAERVVAVRDELLDEAALAPAADLEHTTWRWRQLVEYESGEIHQRCGATRTTRARPRLFVTPAQRDRSRSPERDPTPRLRPARLDLDRRAQPPDRPWGASRRVPGAGGRTPHARGEDLRVLGARSVPRPDRGLPHAPLADAAARGVAPMARQRPRARAGAHAHVLQQISERGPLPSRHFEGKGSGGMWNWKPAKIVLEALHSAGQARDRGAGELPAPLRAARAHRPGRA